MVCDSEGVKVIAMFEVVHKSKCHIAKLDSVRCMSYSFMCKSIYSTGPSVLAPNCKDLLWYVFPLKSGTLEYLNVQQSAIAGLCSVHEYSDKSHQKKIAYLPMASYIENIIPRVRKVLVIRALGDHS